MLTQQEIESILSHISKLSQILDDATTALGGNHKNWDELPEHARLKMKRLSELEQILEAVRVKAEKYIDNESEPRDWIAGLLDIIEYIDSKKKTKDEKQQ